MSTIMTDLTHCKHLEIGQLDLRYAHTRIRKPETLLPLVRSLEKWGQLRPVSVVPSAPPVHVLVDGYLRVKKGTLFPKATYCNTLHLAILQHPPQKAKSQALFNTALSYVQWED